MEFANGTLLFDKGESPTVISGGPPDGVKYIRRSLDDMSALQDGMGKVVMPVGDVH
jgi:hypothetical protein